MLLTALPDLAASSAEFRSWFHARWGRENCIVFGRARRAEFGPCTHTLSIRAAWGGTEHCRIGPRCVGVDDDNFLILNHGRVYSTSIRAQWPVESLAICFRPGLAQETYAAMAMSIERALEQGAAIDPVGPEFAESLQPHDKLVSPVLRFIRAHLLLGVKDEAWYEEQLHFLLARMQTHRARQLKLADELRALDPSRRRELMRRVGVATDFLNTHYAQSVALDDLAKAACLSKHHLLRVFTRVTALANSADSEDFMAIAVTGQVIYRRIPSGQQFDLHAINADGTGNVQLSRSAGRAVFEAVTGSGRVIYHIGGSAPLPGFPGTIYGVFLDGSADTELAGPDVGFIELF